ncbi:MAG TPA: protein-methionine-sulfoxide reductase catalytic subunit MsrP [Acidobacteriaceae bacterium]|nr:protein-methionine-sulfoxide reductase catalytic subunit MsrP [Acidobacteriaceae bacterium]
MLIRKATGLPSSEITPKADYLNRRTFLTGIAAAGAAALAADRIGPWTHVVSARAAAKLQTVKSQFSVKGETPTSYEDITHYNNFYEFGTDKGDPAQNAGAMHTRPWTVQITGLVKKKKTFDIDTLLKMKPMEERIYRFRCVEAWSMVIPWAGYSLSELIKQCDPLPSAKYVHFLSLADPKQMPEINQSGIPFPYTEGLRMDEAMHPLTLLTFGLYGETLPNQDGAPVRVIVPWKYGFKSAKSIVTINFTDKQPPTTWNILASDEYGFYSNVNPNVDHPRWSQRTERRIGASLFKQRQPTLMFNGYGDQVASLYKGMDLKKDF